MNIKNFRTAIALPCAMLLATLLPLAGCGGRQDSIVMECDPDSVADLGALREADGPAFFKIILPNNGTDSLFPLETSTNCSCLTADAERTPVAPGGRMTINASFNPFGADGEVIKEMNILCSPSDTSMQPGKKLRLRIKACVEPARGPLRKDYPFDSGRGLHLSSETLNFGGQAKGGTEEFRLRIASSLNRKAVVTLDIPQELDSVLECRTVELGAMGRDTASVRLNIPNQGFADGRTCFEIIPAVNGRRCRKPLKIVIAN